MRPAIPLAFPRRGVSCHSGCDDFSRKNRADRAARDVVQDRQHRRGHAARQRVERLAGANRQIFSFGFEAQRAVVFPALKPGSIMRISQQQVDRLARSRHAARAENGHVMTERPASGDHLAIDQSHHSPALPSPAGDFPTQSNFINLCARPPPMPRACSPGASKTGSRNRPSTARAMTRPAGSRSPAWQRGWPTARKRSRCRR